MPIKNEEKGQFKKGSKETVEKGRKGGIASGIAKRRKKELRECLEELLERDIKTRDGKTMTGAEAISAKLFQKALNGDVRAFEVLRDSAGQKPIEKIQVAEVDQATIDDVEAIFNDTKAGDK